MICFSRNASSNHLLKFFQIPLGVAPHVKLAELKTTTALELGDNAMCRRSVSPFMRLDAQAFYLFKCILAHSQRGHRGFPAVGYNSARAIEANRRTDSKKRGRHKQKAEDRCTERNSHCPNKKEGEITPPGQRKQQIIGRVQRYQAETKMRTRANGG